MLTQLDLSVRGTVWFSDGSCVKIQGMGSVVIQDRCKGHKVLTDVYYIPELKSNIISLGPLEEKRFKYEGRNGSLCIYDQECRLLIGAPRTRNRLYIVKFGLTSLVCLHVAKSDELAWRWHARYGHLNFKALHDLCSKKHGRRHAYSEKVRADLRWVCSWETTQKVIPSKFKFQSTEKS
jgi:hypothetical protein